MAGIAPLSKGFKAAKRIIEPTYENVRGIVEHAQKAVGAPISEIGAATQKAYEHYGLGVNYKELIAGTEATLQENAKIAARDAAKKETSAVTARTAGSRARKYKIPQLRKEVSDELSVKADNNAINALEETKNIDKIEAQHVQQTAKFKNASEYEEQGSLFGTDEGTLTSTADELAPVYANQHTSENGLRTIEAPTGAGSSAAQEISRGTDAAIEGEMALFDPVPGQGTLMDQLKERVARRKSGTLTPTQESNRIRQEAANETLRRRNEAGKRNAERRAAAYMKQNAGNISENPYDKYKYWGSNTTEEQIIKETVPEPPINENTAWGSTAKAALGTAVAGGALMAALSSSRGQQNNAQLYGQQPLY